MIRLWVVTMVKGFVGVTDTVLTVCTVSCRLILCFIYLFIYLFIVGVYYSVLRYVIAELMNLVRLGPFL